MSKTKRKTPRREFETQPLERHVRRRRCDECELWFPEIEVSQDFNERGLSLGWFCGGCI